MIIDLLNEEEKKKVKFISFKEGETLFYENDTCNELGIVVKGELKISSFTFEGNEIIYNRLDIGSLFGNNLLFSSDNKYRGDVKAVRSGVLALISKDNLINILMNNEKFLLTYLSIHSEFTKSLNTKIKLLTFLNAKERFLYYLFINNNRIRYQSITALAKDLYLSREATSRLISSLEDEGKIIKKNHEIILLD